MKKTEEPSEYEKQANDFLEKTGATITSNYGGHQKHFDGDKEARGIYVVTIKRDGKTPMSFNFGQSINDSWSWRAMKARGHKLENVGFLDKANKDARYLSAISEGREIDFDAMGRSYSLKKVIKAPTAYDILACLTKYNPGTFEDFCGDFGYDTDSRSAEKTYHAAMKEYGDLAQIFSPEELEEMEEIQ